jgi:STE24 endopeptidase
MTPSYAFTLAFAAFLLAGLAVRFWLATRQVRYVAAHRNAVPAAFAETVSLQAHQKAADYTIVKTRFGLLELAWGAAVLLGWTLLGGLDALNQAILGWLDPGMTQQLVLLGSFALISGAADLPFTLYQTFVIEQRFGFNKMSLRLWLADLAKSTAVGLAIGLPIAALILWLMGAAGDLWWLWAWAAWMGFNLLLLVIYPTFIAPLFNKFTPLSDETLRRRTEALLQRCGFTSKGVFVMDGSKRSVHGNAYFTGVGRNKRIVFFDTLIERLQAAEIEAVLAHELGHFRLHHVRSRLVLSLLMGLGGLALLGALAAWPDFYHALGVARPSSHAALLLFMLVLPAFTYFFTPLSTWWSRKHEFEADEFAAQHADAGELAEALVKLYRDNATTLTPDALHSAFYDSHPPAPIRIARLQQLRLKHT